MLLLAMMMQGATPPPLRPTGKWIVSYEDNMCVLSRQFGAGDDLVTFAVKPSGMLGETVEIVLLHPDKGSRYLQTYQSRMAVGPSDATFPATVRTWVIGDKDMRIIRFTIEAPAVQAMIGADVLTLPVERKRDLRIAPETLPAAMRALDTCQKDLLTSWGVDRALLDAVVVPAQGNPARWITSNDYPSIALRTGQTGAVMILWRITPEGTVTDCRVVEHAAERLLGETSCALVTRRGRYEPARDAAGKPISSWSMRRVVWMLPG